MKAVAVGHNKGPALDVESPFANDSLKSLERKLTATSCAILEAEQHLKGRVISLGQILLAAKLKFGLPVKIRGAGTAAEREAFVRFKDWAFKHSGFSWGRCQEYMHYARGPDKYEARKVSRSEANRVKLLAVGRKPISRGPDMAYSIAWGIARKMPDTNLSRLLEAIKGELQRRKKGAKLV